MVKIRTAPKKALKLTGAVLIFCLLLSGVSYAVNTPPVAVSISPSSGTFNVNTPYTFTTVVSDVDGWQNIYYCLFLINTSITYTNCPYLYYSRTSNKLYIRNDSNTAWLGGFTPGSQNTIENSYAKLDCSGTSVSGEGNNLTVNWKITFKTPFTGSKKSYLLAYDLNNVNSGWKQLGAVSIPNSTPQAVSISPSSGTFNVNTPYTFTTVVSDPDGWQNLTQSRLLINSSVSGSNCPYLYYNLLTNKLYLISDTGSWLGGFAPGSANTIENSYASLDCAGTTVSTSGNDMTVNWKITFKTPFTGNKKSYVTAYDINSATSNWKELGSVSIPNTPPQAVSITPSSGAFGINTPYTFTTVVSDVDTWKNIYYCLFLMNTTIAYTNCPYLYYSRTSNKLYLRDNSNTSWLGGYAPGSKNTIENSYVKLDCLGTSVSGEGNNLTVNWKITFKTPFTGSKKSYLLAYDINSVSSGWKQLGTISVSNNPPQAVSITPSSGAFGIDKPHIFKTVCADPDGWQNLYYCLFLINTSVAYINCPYFYYNLNSNALYIRNDSNTAWLGGFTPGSQNTIENSYVKLDCSGTSVSGEGNNLTVSWKITFKPSFTGKKNAYLVARDDLDISSNWKTLGAATIDAVGPTGSLVINNNNKYTNQQQVTLTLLAADDLSGVDTMQFSNDGANWSNPEAYATTRSWDLTSGDGEKTVYARFTDKAGNISISYSKKIILWKGTLIDPAAGGEAVSPDGKIRVIIPPGAIPLDRGPTWISLIPLEITELDNAAPEGYAIQIAVQCEPAGLIFEKAVRLIFILSEAEVPGTPVRLGRSETSEGPFHLLSREALDKEHGNPLEYTLVSFSSYAGLSSMLSQGAPIGSGVKIPLPDLLTGSFGHSVPITVPPGRKSMQPNIALQYRSSSPNSWAGMGWSINPGYIVRSTKLGPPSYDDIKDTFIFVTDSGSTELTHLIDNLYQAKIESSFARFYKEGDTWRVVQKDGTTLRFGQNADSKEISDSGTFLWNLTNVTDNNGNYIDLTYIKDSGKSYLSTIDYTGPSPKNRVEFTLEDRTDISSSFISGSEVKTTKRLKTIEVTQNNDLVWRYELAYEYAAGSKRSLLKSITQYSSDGKAMPAQTFKYQGN